MNPLRRAIGCMTGTSLDGLDVALVTAEGRGLDLAVVSVESASASFGPDVDPLRAFAAGSPLTAAEVADIAAAMGRRHADLITTRWPGLRPDLVAMHGQTVMHRPPRSWQLVDPWPVAAALSCPVVFDLRAADLAAGGEGAPITPLADAILYRRRLRAGATTLVVNLGGFANATLLSGDAPRDARGFDCCPCNHLLDAASRAVLDRPFDDGGRVAAAGVADPETAASLRDVAGRLAREGRSGGDGDEHRDQAVAIARTIGADRGPADALATIAEAIAGAIADSIDRVLREVAAPPLAEVVLAGGGVHHAVLVASLRRHLSSPGRHLTIHAGEVDGVGPSAREAAAMAVLGLLAADGEPITTVGSTGRSAEVRPDGCWIR